MELEGSLPCLQEPVISNYFKVQESNPRPESRFAKDFNIIFPPIPTSYEWF